MPPSAAPEWLRVGCSLEITATFAPASYASMAARMPAQPAPTTRTSCVASTFTDATETPRLVAGGPGPHRAERRDGRGLGLRLHRRRPRPGPDEIAARRVADSRAGHRWPG